MRHRVFPVLLLTLLIACGRGRGPVAVGSKNFTESVILGELVAQQLEAGGCTVERRLNMGGTFVADAAIRSGAIDAYVEYSGTALTAIFHQPPTKDPRTVLAIVRHSYAREGLHWGPELGFNNTFAIIVRKEDAAKLGLVTIADLKKVQTRFQPGFGYEFVERPDGWSGLSHAYGLRFTSQPKTMDLGLTYKALAANRVDVIAGNSTDGLIDPLGLVVLRDERRFFPPYDAGIVSTAALEAKCPGALKALAPLARALDEQTMRRLNYEVDGRKRDVSEVVRQWRSSAAGRARRQQLR